MIDVLSDPIDGDFSTRPTSREMRRQTSNNACQVNLQIRDADWIPLALCAEHFLYGFMNQISSLLSFRKDRVHSPAFCAHDSDGPRQNLFIDPRKLVLELFEGHAVQIPPSP